MIIGKRTLTSHAPWPDQAWLKLRDLAVNLRMQGWKFNKNETRYDHDIQQFLIQIEMIMDE